MRMKLWTIVLGVMCQFQGLLGSRISAIRVYERCCILSIHPTHPRRRHLFPPISSDSSVARPAIHEVGAIENSRRITGAETAQLILFHERAV